MGLKINGWTVGPFATNCYLVHDEETGDAILFDAGMEPERLVDEVRATGFNLVSLINTHGHIDHVAGNQAIVDAFDVPLYIHAADVSMLSNIEAQAQMFGVQAVNSPPPTATLSESDVVKLGAWTFQLFHTPGHSPGSLSFYEPEHQICLVGDTLFAGSIGRTDLPGGDFEVLAASIREKLYVLPDETTILPGHMGLSTIGREKQGNPFVRPA